MATTPVAAVVGVSTRVNISTQTSADTTQAQAVGSTDCTRPKAGKPKAVCGTMQTPKSMLDTDLVADLRKEVSELKNELSSVKQELKKSEVALKFARERLAAEMATNITYHEDFDKVADQIRRIQHEKVALIKELATLKLEVEDLPSPRPVQQKEATPSVATDVQQQLEDFKAAVNTAVNSLSTGKPDDRTWTEVTRSPRKVAAKGSSAPGPGTTSTKAPARQAGEARTSHRQP